MYIANICMINSTTAVKIKKKKNNNNLFHSTACRTRGKAVVIFSLDGINLKHCTTEVDFVTTVTSSHMCGARSQLV
jgi:hypothetical protein